MNGVAYGVPTCQHVHLDRVIHLKVDARFKSFSVFGRARANSSSRLGNLHRCCCCASLGDKRTCTMRCSRVMATQRRKQREAEGSRERARSHRGRVTIRVCRVLVVFALTFLLSLLCSATPVSADTEAPKVTDLLITPLVGSFPTVDVRTSSQVVTLVSLTCLRLDSRAPLTDSTYTSTRHRL